tara:strand:+ start:440 stop:694 length:255 start_codon:yes stop_codon:yes gene_type:complete
MKLSNQAMGAIMMALQNSLMEQTDIVPVLQSFEFVKSPDTKRWGTKNGELVVENPPTVKAAQPDPAKEYIDSVHAAAHKAFITE